MADKSDSTLTAAIANAVQAVTSVTRRTGSASPPTNSPSYSSPVSLTSRTLGAAHTADKDANTVGFIAVGFMYLVISFYAGFVLTGVVQEKANRVAKSCSPGCPHVRFSPARSSASASSGLPQLAVIGAAAVTTVAFMGGADAPSIPGDVLAWTCMWFVLGYLFYSVLYAALGATTSRIEDAQAAIAPITGLMLLSYFGVIYAEENLDAVVTILLSYFRRPHPSS